MNEAFEFTTPLWEIAVRTSVVFLAIIVLLRIAPKRRSGSISPNDMIFLVLIGALAGDATMGGSTSIADILAMIAVIVAWGYFFDYLEYCFPAIGRFFRESESLLIRDGRMLRRNMRREFVSDEELMAALREQGIEDVQEVRSACLEADGQISVIKRRSSSGEGN
jgi:uncharacterized membrane protein YcaP (DUF421 family)